MATPALNSPPVAPADSDVPRMWSLAILRYEELTATKLPHPTDIQNITQLFDEVLSTGDRFKGFRHDGSKVDRLRSSVARCLHPLQQLGGLVTQATKSVYPPSEAIFAAMKYLIGSANATSADYEALESVFEDLQIQLHSLKIVESELSYLPELEAAVVRIFTSALILCAICTQYIRKQRIRKALRALISGRDEKLKSATDDFHRSVKFGQDTISKLLLVNSVHIKLDTTSTLQHVADLEGSSGQMMGHIEDLKLSQERENVLGWLSQVDYLGKQRDIFAKHQRNTGEWLLGHPSFRHWRDGDESSVLWCRGIPGAGKTVMTARIIRHIEECMMDFNTAIAYIYCDYKTPYTAVEMISSLARQLAQQCSHLPMQVKLFHGTWAEKKSYPSHEAYVSLIEGLSRNFAKVFVFVDALDECVEQTRVDFLSMLLDSRATLRLFLTSRKSLDLQGRLGDSHEVEIVASTSDIREYLATNISRTERLTSVLRSYPDLENQIIDTVQEKAGGMFLLASLHFDHISKQSTARKIRDALRTLPRGIASFYEQAMQRIVDLGEEDSVLARKTLSFIFSAQRSLNTAEILAALSVEPGDSELDDENCPSLSTILGACVGLVSVDNNTGTIGLVHTTLYEYLQEHPASLLPDPHSEMTKVSTTYLSFRYFAEGPCTDGMALAKRLQQYPLLEYACKHWGVHARCSDRQDLAAVLAFLGSGANLASSVQVLYSNAKRTEGWHSRHPARFGPMHAAAYWGLEDALDVFCEDGYDIDAQDSQGNTALHLAAQQGHTALLEKLLARGARADLANEKGYTALIWAGRNAHAASITPLLSAHRNLWEHDVEGWTALDWAIIGRHHDTAKALLSHAGEAFEASRLNKTLMLAAEAGNDQAVEILLEKGAEINGVDEEGSTALDFAVPEGKEKVARLLLDRGANPNSGDNYGHTALHWALAYPNIAKLLLQHGATVDPRNRRKQTPLLWCAKEAQIDTLVLLLQSGAAVNACDDQGTTVLHAVAAKGNEAMVKLLLDEGADATLEDCDGWTPVQTALIRGHNHLLPAFALKATNCQGIADYMARVLGDENNAAWLQELAMAKSEGSVQVSGLRVAVNSGQPERVLALINAGADINACDDVGGSTALTLATWLGRTHIAKILIENGADVDIPDATGATALHIAAKYGYESSVALLVNSGASVDKPLHSWSPLLLASKDCHHDCSTRIAELLIDGGADVTASDYHGRTALHWAAFWGQSVLARDLIQQGARVDAQDRWGMTPLIWASAGERTRHGGSACNPTAGLLLDNQADPNAETVEGYRAVHLAALAGDTELLGQLLQHGADPEAMVGTLGLEPLDMARIMDHKAAVSLLEARGVQPRPPAQWRHARDVALAFEEREGPTKPQRARLIEITTVSNEVICVDGLYEALRNLARDSG